MNSHWLQSVGYINYEKAILHLEEAPLCKLLLKGVHLSADGWDCHVFLTAGTEAFPFWAPNAASAVTLFTDATTRSTGISRLAEISSYGTKMRPCSSLTGTWSWAGISWRKRRRCRRSWSPQSSAATSTPPPVSWSCSCGRKLWTAATRYLWLQLEPLRFIHRIWNFNSAATNKFHHLQKLSAVDHFGLYWT